MLHFHTVNASNLLMHLIAPVLQFFFYAPSRQRMSPRRHERDFNDVDDGGSVSGDFANAEE
jgi:hypothetical protein